MPGSDARGYYRVLGVSADASADDIKRAFREQAKKYHPDTSAEPDAHQFFVFITEAYEVLGDPLRRRAYDTPAGPQEVYEYPSANDRGARPPPVVEPVRCASCEAIAAQPRLVTFWIAEAQRWQNVMIPLRGIWCSRCAAAMSWRAVWRTVCRGWFSADGPFWVVACLLQTVLGGEPDAQTNAVLTRRQAEAFVARGDVPLARAVMKKAIAQARRIPGPEGLEVLREMVAYAYSLGGTPKSEALADPWDWRRRPSSWAQLAVTAMCLTPFLAVFWLAVEVLVLRSL